MCTVTSQIARTTEKNSLTSRRRHNGLFTIPAVESSVVCCRYMEVTSRLPLVTLSHADWTCHTRDTRDTRDSEYISHACHGGVQGRDEEREGGLTEERSGEEEVGNKVHSGLTDDSCSK